MNIKEMTIIINSNTDIKVGSKVKLLDSDLDKAKWGGNFIPSKYLTIGEIYTVSKVEVHTWHTKLWLEGFDGKHFNESHFELISNKGD